MNNTYSSPIFDDQDEYPKVTQVDLDRAKFRVGLKSAPQQQRVTLLLDTVLIEYFKARAGENDYQILINDALHQVVTQQNVQRELEETLRQVIREELHLLNLPISA
ncbi:MAG: BrnA antitoxin family protein [Caldilineaceae bacterium]